MATLEKLLVRWTTVSSIAVLLIACGGGGGDSDSNYEIDEGVDVDTGGSNTQTLHNVNGSLSGVYFSTTPLNEGEWLNLETGEIGAFYEHDDNMPPGLLAIVPSKDGTEYLELYADDSVYGDTKSTILIKDMRTGLVVDEFTVTGELSSSSRSLRFSPDRQIISVRRDTNYDYDYRLTFYTRTGNLIAQFTDTSIIEYAWIPDGRFAFFKDDQLHIGELRGPDEVVTYPVVSIAHLNGWPQNLAVSPGDELRFAFEMAIKAPTWLEGNSYRDATVWRVEGDGSNLQQVATMADYNGNISESPRINNPLWTLDGNYLLMSAGVSSSVVVSWGEQYNPETDQYEPSYIEDVVSSNTEGFMYLLPDDASDVVLLGEQSFPVIGFNCGGEVCSYAVSPIHITSGAMMIQPVTPLEESVVSPNNGPTGSLFYRKDWYEDEYDDKLIVMRYDAASGEEQIHWQIAGEDFHRDPYFSMSADGQTYAHWNEISYDDKVLRIYDSSGQELQHFQMVDSDNSGTKGADLISAPRFSPVNNNLLLYRFTDESDDEKVKFGVADWTTGEYVIMYEGEYDSVAWEPDGSIVASVNKGVYRFAYQGGSFADPVQLFATPNAAKYLDVSADGLKYLFTMSGRIFWCLADGSELAQVTAPPATGLEYWPKWSADGRHIMFMKDGRRYIISADSRNLHISLNMDDNASKAKHVTREGGRVGYWRP
jgi:hypothetical protein